MEKPTQRDVDERAQLEYRENVRDKLENIVKELNSLINLEWDGALESSDYSYLRTKFPAAELDVIEKAIKRIRQAKIVEEN